MIIKFPKEVISKCLGNSAEAHKYQVEHIINNLDDIRAEKIGTLKKADGCLVTGVQTGRTSKADGNGSGNGPLKARLIINTTYVMDSHKDVHINGIWDDDLVNADKTRPLLQEHVNSFANVIDDSAKASVKTYEWTQMGLKAEGKTQALVFDANISAKANAFMYDRYKGGFVKNHSVGMTYGDFAVAVNDEENYPEEYKNWKKYFPKIVNGAQAEKTGYFFAITKAGVIEGSAVPMGSNRITPTFNITETDKGNGNDKFLLWG